MGIHVDHFPGEVQPGEQLALHGGGLYLLHVHAAPGDNGLGQGTPGAQGDGQGLERRPQLFTLPTGDLPADALPADACQVGEQGAEPQGQKARQYVLQLLAGLGRKVPLQPEV